MTPLKWKTLILLLAACVGAIAEETIEAKWDELGPLLGTSKVSLLLPEGAEIQGMVLRVEPDGLRLKVQRTSDRKVMPKGERLIPRASVSLLRSTQYRGFARLLCGVGLPAAVVGAVVTQNIDIYEGPAVVAVPAVIAAGAIGAGVGGYYIGKRIDRKVTYIRVR